MFHSCLFSEDKQAEIIEAFNLMSGYLDGPLNMDNTYSDGMVYHISSNTETPFQGLCLSMYITNGFGHLKFMINAMIFRRTIHKLSKSRRALCYTLRTLERHV